MESKKLAGLFAIALASLQLISAAADKFKPEDYKEVDYRILRATADDYKNKRVCFSITLHGLDTDFSPFLERMGFKDDKYFRLMTGNSDMGGAGLPVFAKRTEEIKTSLPMIKNQSTVKVYGKIRKFALQPSSHEGAFPNYYVETDSVELVKGPEAVKDQAKEQAKEQVKERRQNRREREAQLGDVNDNIPKPPKGQ